MGFGGCGRNGILEWRLIGIIIQLPLPSLCCKETDTFIDTYIGKRPSNTTDNTLLSILLVYLLTNSGESFVLSLVYDSQVYFVITKVIYKVFITGSRNFFFFFFFGLTQSNLQYILDR